MYDEDFAGPDDDLMKQGDSSPAVRNDRYEA